MSAQPEGFLEEWHRVVAEKDLVALPDLLAPEIALGAPPYWEKMRGHDLVAHLLGLILHTIEDFTYHREWADGGELALEFSGRVEDLDLQGIDLITLDADNRIANLDVLIRPHNAVTQLIEVVRPKMVEYLKAQSGT